MRHALMYAGGFETNFPGLKSGARTFRGTDGAEHSLAGWPAEADGVRVSYMEKAGKHFSAVRVQHGTSDVVLQNAVLLDPSRHLGYGHRFSPEPTLIDDEMAEVLLADMLARNPDQRDELAAIRSAALGKDKPRPE